MEIETTIKDFKSCIDIINNIPTKRNSQDFLKIITIETAANGKIIVNRKNFDDQLSCICDGQIEESGNVLLDIQELNQVIKNNEPDATIKLKCKTETNNNTITIKDKYGLITQQLSYFPIKAKPVYYNSLEIFDDCEVMEFIPIIKQFIPVIKEAMIFAAKEDSRPVLSSVLLKIEDNYISIVSADGFRLYINKLLFANSKTLQIILPIEMCKILIHTFDKSSELRMKYKDGFISFNDSRNIFIGKCTTGIFPNYEMLIPTYSQFYFTINSNVLMNRINKALSINSNSAIKMDTITNKLRISSSENNKFKALLDAVMNNGSRTAISKEFLNDICNVFVCPTFKINNMHDPVKILENENESKMIIQMPMYLQ
jgi:DNA polymerase III subunit beta